MIDVYNARLSRAPLKFQLFCAAAGFLYVYLSPEQEPPGIFFLILKAIVGVALAISVAGFYVRYKEHSTRPTRTKASENALLQSARFNSKEHNKAP